MSTSTETNSDLHEAYSALWDDVVSTNKGLFDGLGSIKESRKNFSFDPFLSSLKGGFPNKSGENASLRPYLEKDNLLLNEVVDFIVDGLYEQLQYSKEYEDLVTEMNNDPIIKTQLNKIHRVSGTIQTMRPWTYISHILKRLLFQYIDDHHVDRGFLNQVVSEQETFFHSDCLPYMIICPLIFFKLDKVSSPIQITDEISIRPFTELEKLILSRNFIKPDINSSSIDYAIEYKFNLIKGFDINFEDQQKDFPDDALGVFSTIITLFRLIRVNVAIHENITMPTQDIPIAKWTLNLFILAMGVVHGTTPYVDSAMVSNFQMLWTSFGELLRRKVFDNKRYEGDPFSNLKISIHRFISAYDRKDGNDAFIDNIIALEALFSKKSNDHRGTAVKISKRIATYLEANLPKRKKIFCDMVKLYDARGKIVHGGEATEQINIVKTRDYLIRSYLKYFEFLKQDGFSHTSFVETLESEIKNFRMEKKNCEKPKHIRNDSHDYSLPAFLFQG